MRRVDFGLRIDARTAGQDRIVGILDVVDRAAGLPVEPEIAHHAVGGRLRARGQRGMTHHRLGIRVGVVRIVVVDPLLQQVAETPVSELREMSKRQVAPQLVHSDLEDQPGALSGLDLG